MITDHGGWYYFCRYFRMGAVGTIFVANLGRVGTIFVVNLRGVGTLFKRSL